MIPINMKKVLSNKNVQAEVTSRDMFKSLQENNSAVNQIKYLIEFKKMDFDEILENLNTAYSIGGSGVIFAKDFIKITDAPLYKLQEQQTKLKGYIQRLKMSKFIEPTLITENESLLEALTDEIKFRDTDDYRKIKFTNSIIMDKLTEGYKSSATLDKELGGIINNINQDVNAFYRYERIIRDIKASKPNEIINICPKILEANLKIVLNMREQSSGANIPLLAKVACDVPVTVAYKVIDSGDIKYNYTNYMKLYDNQINMVYKELQRGSSTKYNIYMAYVDSLKRAQDILTRAKEDLTENMVFVNENLKYSDELKALYKDTPERIIFEDLNIDTKGIFEDSDIELDEEDIIDNDFEVNENLLVPTVEEQIEQKVKIFKTSLNGRLKRAKLLPDINDIKKDINDREWVKNAAYVSVMGDCIGDPKLFVLNAAVSKLSGEESFKYNQLVEKYNVFINSDFKPRLKEKEEDIKSGNLKKESYDVSTNFYDSEVKAFEEGIKVYKNADEASEDKVNAIKGGYMRRLSWCKNDSDIAKIKEDISNNKLEDKVNAALVFDEKGRVHTQLKIQSSKDKKAQQTKMLNELKRWANTEFRGKIAAKEKEIKSGGVKKESYDDFVYEAGMKNFGTSKNTLWERTIQKGLLDKFDECKTIEDIIVYRKSIEETIVKITDLEKSNIIFVSSFEPLKWWIKTDLIPKTKRREYELRKQRNSISENIAMMQPDIFDNKEMKFNELQSRLTNVIADIMYEPGDEVSDEVAMEFMNVVNEYDELYSLCNEGISEPLIKGAENVDRVGQKVVAKVQDIDSKVKRIEHPLKRTAAIVPNAIVDSINKTIDEFKKRDKDERRERIVSGSFRLKIKNFFKKGINLIFIGGMVANPIIGLIGILTSMGIDKHIEEKERKLILKDMEDELVIVNEKIDDAKSDGDKKAKYELMRVKAKLEKDIERIKFNLEP